MSDVLLSDSIYLNLESIPRDLKEIIMEYWMQIVIHYKPPRFWESILGIQRVSRNNFEVQITVNDSFRFRFRDNKHYGSKCYWVNIDGKLCTRTQPVVKKIYFCRAQKPKNTGPVCNELLLYKWIMEPTTGGYLKWKCPRCGSFYI